MNTVKQMISLFIVIGACLGIAAFVLALTSKQNCDTKERYESSECKDAVNDIKYKLSAFCCNACTKPDDPPSPVKGGKTMCTSTDSNCKTYDKLCQQLCHTVTHDSHGCYGAGCTPDWEWSPYCNVNDKTNNYICGDDEACKNNHICN